MDKNRFTRMTQQHNLLKKVIIRIDYTGLVTATGIVDALKKEYLRTYFDSFYKKYVGQAKLNVSDLNSIAKTLMIPVEDLKNEPLYVFTATPFPNTNDSVAMEVSAYYTAMSITCCMYKSIDPYRNLLVEYVEFLRENEIAFRINRLGIRKASGDLFDDADSLSQTYEPTIFYGLLPDEKMGLINKEYLDCFYNENQDIKVNYKRAITSVMDSERNRKLQAGLDIDVYVDSEIVQKKGLDLKEHFAQEFDRLNEYQFVLYRNSVTEQYLAQTNHE